MKRLQFGFLLSLALTMPMLGQKMPEAYMAPADNISQTMATLHAQVLSESNYTDLFFQCSGAHQFNLNANAPDDAPYSVGQTIAIDRVIGSLTPGAQYFCQMIASNAYGTSYSDYISFKTATEIGQSEEPAQAEEHPPQVTTGNAVVYRTFAQLNGLIDPRGSHMYYWFEYGTMSATLYHKTETFEASGESSLTTTSISASFDGLESNRTYYYRIVGKNAFGTSHGDVQNFVIPPRPNDDSAQAKDENTVAQDTQEEQPADESQNGGEAEDEKEIDSDESDVAYRLKFEEAMEVLKVTKLHEAAPGEAGAQEDSLPCDERWWERYLALRPDAQEILDIVGNPHVKDSCRHLAAEELMRRDHNVVFLYSIARYGIMSDREKAAEKLLDLTDLSLSDFVSIIQRVPSAKIRARAWERLIKTPATREQLEEMAQYLSSGKLDTEPYAKLIADLIERTPSTKRAPRASPPPKPSNLKVEILRHIMNDE